MKTNEILDSIPYPIVAQYLKSQYPSVYSALRSGEDVHKSDVDKIRSLVEYLEYREYTCRGHRISNLFQKENYKDILNLFRRNQDDISNLIYLNNAKHMGNYKDTMYIPSNFKLKDLSFTLNTTNYINSNVAWGLTSHEIRQILYNAKIALTKSNYCIYPVLKKRVQILHDIQTTIYGTVMTTKDNNGNKVQRVGILKEDYVKQHYHNYKSHTPYSISYTFIIDGKKKDDISDKQYRNSNFLLKPYDHIRDNCAGCKILRLDVSPINVHTNFVNQIGYIVPDGYPLIKNGAPQSHLHILDPFADILQSNHNLPYAIPLPQIEKCSQDAVIDSVRKCLNIIDTTPLYPTSMDENPAQPYSLDHYDHLIKKDVENALNNTEHKDNGHVIDKFMHPFYANTLACGLAEDLGLQL